MKLSLLVVVFAFLLVSFAASTARADGDFTFSATPTITAASANPPGTTNTITNGVTISGLPASTFSSVAATGTSTISLLGRNTSGPLVASGSVDTQFLDVIVTSNDTASRLFSTNFDIAYVLTDPTPNGGPGPQVTHFAGKVTGQIGGGTTTVGFSLADFNPGLNAGSFVLAGDGTFRLILASIVNPSLGVDLGGHLTARVTSIPEPTTAVLFAIGAIGLATRYRRQSTGH